MSILETVRRICQEAAVTLPGAEVVAPLPVWNNDGKSMGVQIKAPRKMGTTECEVTAGFVLSPLELTTPELIRVKAVAAVACMTRDIQVSIKPIADMSQRMREIVRRGEEDRMQREHGALGHVVDYDAARAASPMTDAATEPAIRFADVLTETPEAIKYSRRIVTPMTDAQAEDITRRSV